MYYNPTRTFDNYVIGLQLQLKNTSNSWSSMMYVPRNLNRKTWLLVIMTCQLTLFKLGKPKEKLINTSKPDKKIKKKFVAVGS